MDFSTAIFRFLLQLIVIKSARSVPTTVSNVTSDQLLSFSSCENSTEQKASDPERFSKLKLNVKELYGSRWALDQKDAIVVTHAIDISDATLELNNQLTLRVEFNLRQMWDAPGLIFPPGLFKDDDPPGTFVSADDKVLANMWSPDSYISTARESKMHTVGTPLSFVYIFKNRTITFKVRMFTKVGCTSSFQWYPLDTQTCTLMIESYKYHDDIVRYQWTDESIYRPVVLKIMRLFQYDLQLPLNHTNGTVERGGRGKRYAFIQIKFTFDRKLGNNIIQVYTPTLLVVVLSWFSFWLGLDAIPGRISLLVTCMLTLVTMHSGIKSSIPPVHYITMMDVWMVCCMGMVFSAMCEFVVVKFVHWRQQQKQKAAEKMKEMHNNEVLISFFQQFQAQIYAESRDAKMAWSKSENGKKGLPAIPELKSVIVDARDLTGGGNEKVDSGQGNHKSPERKVVLEGFKEAEEMAPWWVGVDKFCRALFPCLFCLFNAVYWPVLLCGGGQVQDDSISYHQD